MPSKIHDLDAEPSLEQGLRRKIWHFLQFSAAVATVAALVVTVLFNLRSTQVKEVRIEYISERPLVLLDDPNTPRVEMTYGGVEVDSPWLVTMKYSNSGDVPVMPQDVEKPLSIGFGNSVLVAGEVAEAQPPDISNKLVIVRSGAILEHGLLNPGDSIEMIFLLDGQPASRSISARIAGISAPIQEHSNAHQEEHSAILIDAGAGEQMFVVAMASVGVAISVLVSSGLLLAIATGLNADKELLKSHIDHSLRWAVLGRKTTAEDMKQEAMRILDDRKDKLGNKFLKQLSEQIDSVSTDVPSAEAYREAVKRALSKVPSNWTFSDFALVAGVVVLVSMMVSAGFVMAGSWSLLLSRV